MPSQGLEFKEDRIATLPPEYRPLISRVTTSSQRRHSSATRANQDRTNADLHLRVQLAFGRGGVVSKLALVPDRRDGMPCELDVKGTHGEFHLTASRDDCYEPIHFEPINFPSLVTVLRQGIEWRGQSSARKTRWVLSGRELYVLAPGNELSGFVSTARLWLNAQHVVLATKRLREDVISALAESGCNKYEVIEDEHSGMPEGWVLFRNVEPTRSVLMRDTRDILNSLCPALQIEPNYVGGVRLERKTWLAGYPPRIRFMGDFTNNFYVNIDSHPAHRASDGAFEAPGWDSEGKHRLCFGDRVETYSLNTMNEAWQPWDAHAFGTEATICGAAICLKQDTRETRILRIPGSNPLIIGQRPGEIFRCSGTGETLLARVSFEPVWAVPINPAHANKRSARIILLNPHEPQTDIYVPLGNSAAKRNLVGWLRAVHDAGYKGLGLDPENESTKILWRQYRAIAKQLQLRMR
ncbi:MAG: hypothetical protein ACRER2_08445 [Methylococcales bacterium]